ncbi:MAG: sigma-70 family RNA polymerase sigma factor [Pirellulaceae bacterium]
MKVQSSQPQPAEHPTLSSMFLDGVQTMQPESWSRLVHTFGPIVYRWCRTSGVSESDSPDLVQDVFASVARGIPDFQRQKDSGSFRSWLATITRNRVRDYFRRQSRQQSAAGGTEALQFLQQQADAVDDSICGDSIDSPLVRRVLESVRSEFEQTTWHAFWLTTIESQSPSVVAETTGRSVASVYQAKSRILRRLRQAMAELPT